MSKRILCAVLSALMLISCSGYFSVGATSQADKATGATQKIFQTQKNNAVLYYDEQGNQVDITDLNADVNASKAELPSKYDLRDEARVTPVRDQGSEGLCWDFAATASIESNILSQPDMYNKIGSGAEAKLDLSEAGNAWYIHTPMINSDSLFAYDYLADPAKGANGGDSEIVAVSLFSGYGAYPESLLPYEQWNNGCSQSLRFYSDYRLRDFSKLSNDNALIKQKIIENGAVTVNYGCYSANTYITDGMQAYYDNGSPIDGVYGLGHLVAIVGWDDSFSRERFNPLMQPTGDGAWLCKNSWGEDNCSTAEGYEGYFWMSYETSVIGITQFIMQDTDSFDNIYQNQITSDYSVKTDKAANVFTAKGDETLAQIGFDSLGEINARVEVYRLNDGYSSPVDGTRLAEFDIAADFTGIHMYDCPKGINLKKGEAFSVVVSNKGEEMYIKLSSDKIQEQSGQSYFSYQNGDWQDAGCTTDGFASIKAFTLNTSETADKTELISLIKTSTAMSDDSTLDEAEAQHLKDMIKNAQDVADNSSATQAQVNNAYCLLNSAVEKINFSSFEINSAEDYNRLSENAAFMHISDIKQITLNADLDFNGQELKPLLGEMEYSGIFEGNGHTISNFVLNTASVFSKLSNAEIRNLTVSDCTASSDMDAQILAEKCSDTSFINCKIENCEVNSSKYAAAFSSNNTSVAIKDCSVINTKIYGDYGAGVFFAYGRADSDIGCISSGVELYSFNFVTDNSKCDVSAYPSDFFSKEQHILSCKDGQFYLEQFTAEISTVTAYGATAEKTGEGSYLITPTDANSYVEVSYANNQNSFTVKGNLKTRELFLSGYTGSDVDLIIPSQINGIDISGFDEEFNSSVSASLDIKSLTVPGTITNISSGAFSSMPCLEKVVLCEGVKTVSSEAFSYCPNLRTVTLPDSLEIIDSAAFIGCENLADINYPNELVGISEYAFSNCKSLSAPTLPDSVKFIGQSAFAGCTFTSVLLGKNIEEIEDDAFGSTIKGEMNFKTVYIPNFTVNGYKTTAAKDYAQKYGFDFVDIEVSSPVMDATVFDYGIFISGDVDLNGKVTITDATAIMKWLAEICELSPIQRCNAVVGELDSSISIKNATKVQKYLAGLIYTLDSTAAG